MVGSAIDLQGKICKFLGKDVRSHGVILTCTMQILLEAFSGITTEFQLKTRET